MTNIEHLFFSSDPI